MPKFESIKGYCETCSWLMDTTHDEQNLGIYCFLTTNDVKMRDYCSRWTDQPINYKTEQPLKGDDSEEHV